jgi:hypothetical protein
MELTMFQKKRDRFTSWLHRPHIALFVREVPLPPFSPRPEVRKYLPFFISFSSVHRRIDTLYVHRSPPYSIIKPWWMQLPCMRLLLKFGLSSDQDMSTCSPSHVHWRTKAADAANKYMYDRLKLYKIFNTYAPISKQETICRMPHGAARYTPRSSETAVLLGHLIEWVTGWKFILMN